MSPTFPLDVLPDAGRLQLQLRPRRRVRLANGRRRRCRRRRAMRWCARSMLDSGLRLVVGRDVVERRGFTAIIFQGFLFGVLGIIVFSIIAGVVTARRVLRRIDTISGTSTKIMSGNLSERVPVTRRNDEFDGLATNLNAMLDRIEQLMQGLKEVTDNVAHDLKTPLTRLRNKAEAALREGASPTSQRAGARDHDRRERQADPDLQCAADDRPRRGRRAVGRVRRYRHQRRRRRRRRTLWAGGRGAGHRRSKQRITPGIVLRANRELHRPGAGQSRRQRPQILRDPGGQGTAASSSACAPTRGAC